MAAPLTAVITGMRDGTLRRHMFFRLDHPAGVVRLWDGIGTYTLASELYLGAGGLISVDGVSASSDIENAEVQIKLEGMQLSYLRDNSLNIRNRNVVIRAAWVNEAGTAVANVIVFSGRANRVTSSDLTADQFPLTLTARGLMTDWAHAPQATYTDAYQKRLFPGDTGMRFMSTLTSGIVTGWSAVAESTGGYVSHDGAHWRDTATNSIIGFLGRGVLAGIAGTAGQPWRLPLVNDPFGLRIVEDVTGAINQGESVFRNLNFSSGRAYVDINGDVRSPAGNLVRPDGLTNTFKMRRHGAITTVGTIQTTQSIVMQNGVLWFDGKPLFRRSNVVDGLASGSSLMYIYDNRGGMLSRSGSSFNLGQSSTPFTYIEDVTNAVLTLSVGNTLQISGQDVRPTSTGFVVSAAGRRIYRQGTNSSDTFLRFFT